MKTVDQTFTEIKTALTRALGTQYVDIEPSTLLDFSANDYFSIILRKLPYSRYNTLDLKDAFIVRYRIDVEFSEKVDAMLKSIKTYQELAEMVFTFKKMLCEEEHLYSPFKKEEQVRQHKEYDKDISEIKELILQTGKIKKSLSNLAIDLEELNTSQFRPSETDKVELILELMKKGLELKTELNTLIMNSQSKLTLMKFKSEFRPKYNLN